MLNFGLESAIEWAVRIYLCIKWTALNDMDPSLDRCIAHVDRNETRIIQVVNYYYADVSYQF